MNIFIYEYINKSLLKVFFLKCEVAKSLKLKTREIGAWKGRARQNP